MTLRLFNLLRRHHLPRRELFVHEDDWGQIEVLPASCAEWCAAEMARVAAFADQHAAPGGIGWTDVYVRSQAPGGLADLGIPFELALAGIGKRLPPFDVVTSGTFSAPEPVPHVRAFGSAPNVGAVLVPSRDAGTLQMVTLVLDGGAADCAAVIAALAVLSSPRPLLIADWLRGHTLALSTEQAARGATDFLD